VEQAFRPAHSFARMGRLESLPHIRDPDGGTGQPPDEDPDRNETFGDGGDVNRSIKRKVAGR